MLWGIISTIPLLIKSANCFCAAFKNSVVLFSFIAWWKCLVYVSDTATLENILICIDILMVMAMISSEMVVTKAYYFAYVGNLCPKMDMVIIPTWLSYVFFRNLSIYCKLLLQRGLLKWWFMGIIFLHWFYWCLFFWFWGILSGCTILIWWINKCIWWIILLIMYKHWFLSFYKPTHGLSVAGWNYIPITNIDSGKVRIKFNMEMWWYPSHW